MGNRRKQQGGEQLPEPHGAARSPYPFLASLLIYGVCFFALELKTLSDKLGESFRRVEVFGFLGELPFVIGNWFGAPGEAGVIDRWPILLTATAIVGISTLAGWLLLDLFRLRGCFDREERIALSGATGLQLTSLLQLSIGTGWSTQVAWPWYAFALLVLALAAWRWKIGAKENAAIGRVQEPSPLSSRWLWLLLPPVVILIVGAMLPPVDFDVREYHLQAPKEFYQNGSIGFLAHNIYGNMPLGAELPVVLGMNLLDDWQAGALVGKTVMASYTLFAVLLVFAAARRWFGGTASIVATLLLLTTPWILKVSGSGLNEGASALYWLAAVVVAARLREEQAPHVRLSLLAGWLAGAAAACKYPAALFVIIPLFVWIAIQARQWSWRPAAAFGLAATVSFGPWLLKNWLLTGNPAYPLLYSIFGGNSRTPELIAQWNAAHRPPGFSAPMLLESAYRFLLANDWASPWLIPLAAIGLTVAWSQRIVRDLACYLVFVLICWWLFTHRIDRFLVPLLPIVALLASAGGVWLHRAMTERDARLRWALPAMLVIGWVYAVLLATTGAQGTYQKFFVGLDVLHVDPIRVDPIHHWANDPANRVTGLLLVGDAQPFDLRVPVVYNTVFDPSELLALEPSVPGKFHARLKKQGISHVAVHWGEIDRYRGPGNYGFPQEITPELFAQLVDASVLKPLGEADPQNRHRLYEVVSIPENR